MVFTFVVFFWLAGASLDTDAPRLPSGPPSSRTKRIVGEYRRRGTPCGFRRATGRGTTRVSRTGRSVWAPARAPNGHGGCLSWGRCCSRVLAVPSLPNPPPFSQRRRIVVEYRPLPTRRTVARRPPSPASCTCRAPRPPPSLARPPPSASMMIFSRVHGPVRGATSGSADALWVPPKSRREPSRLSRRKARPSRRCPNPNPARVRVGLAGFWRGAAELAFGWFRPSPVHLRREKGYERGQPGHSFDAQR